MSRLFVGNIPNVGPAVKIMANDVDDPRTTPNTAWWKFRFNSETAEIGYARYIPTVDSSVFNTIGWVRPYATNWTKIYGIYVDNYGGSDDAHYNFGPIRPPYMDASFPGTDTVPRTGILEINGTYQYGYWSFSKSDAVVNYNWRDYTDAINSDRNIVGDPYPYAWYSSELPIDETPYPSVVGSHVPNKKIIRIDDANVKIAKPGFDVDLATDDQLIIGHNKPPLLVARTGLFTLAAGAQQNIDVDLPISPDTLVDFQVSITGQDLYLPAWPGSISIAVGVQYRIVGQQVQFKNTSNASVDVRFFIMAADSLGTTSGNARVLKNDGGYIQLLRPGSSLTPNAKDILLDSRATYLPMIAQGYAPLSAFNSSGGSYLGPYVYRVNLPAGDYKPYVLARGKCSLVSGGGFFYSDFFGKQIEIYSHMSQSTFLAHVGDTFVDFYASNGGMEDAWRYGSGYGQGIIPTTFLGVRYYIFAVPNSL